MIDRRFQRQGIGVEALKTVCVRIYHRPREHLALRDSTK